MNLVFPGARLGDVVGALVEAGWSLAGFGALQVVLVPATGAELRQGAQLFNSDGTTFAPTRFHIRLWQLPDTMTIGAVHHETTAATDQIDRDWEDAEARVRQDLCTASVRCETGGVISEQRSQQQGTEQWRRFVNDARPTVIWLPRLSD